MEMRQHVANVVGRRRGAYPHRRPTTMVPFLPAVRGLPRRQNEPAQWAAGRFVVGAPTIMQRPAQYRVQPTASEDVTVDTYALRYRSRHACSNPMIRRGHQ